MPGKFELKRSKKQFMFSLMAVNGRVILTSERYTTKRAAENGIKSVKKHARADTNYERRTTKNAVVSWRLHRAPRSTPDRNSQSSRFGSPSVDTYNAPAPLGPMSL